MFRCIFAEAAPIAAAGCGRAAGLSLSAAGRNGHAAQRAAAKADSSVKPLWTNRLKIRPMTADDAPFILMLLNEPSWLRFIGDRGVHSLEDARAYILSGPMDMYARLGLGFSIVEANDANTPMGICGLAKRDYLEDIDLGFAFLPRYWGGGYAREAALEVLRDARERLMLGRIVATTRADNIPSRKLLERLGFQFERDFIRPDTGQALQLYASCAGADERDR